MKKLIKMFKAWKLEREFKRTFGYSHNEKEVIYFQGENEM